MREIPQPAKKSAGSRDDAEDRDGPACEIEGFPLIEPTSLARSIIERFSREEILLRGVAGERRAGRWSAGRGRPRLDELRRRAERCLKRQLIPPSRWRETSE